jgi:hypothetical protein
MLIKMPLFIKNKGMHQGWRENKAPLQALIYAATTQTTKAP